MFVLMLTTFNYIVIRSTKNLTFDSVTTIPKNKVGLLLGTSKYLRNGYINLYYKYRVDATVRLYKAGKIAFVLISGDNGNTNYDEPSTFKADLIKSGIPADKIFLDYAGFRTLDSVVRANAIFGQSSFTIISQKFHNERAVFIAMQKGLKAVAYNAKDVSKRYGIKVQLREYLARAKVFVDLLFAVKPKFLGEKIEIK